MSKRKLPFPAPYEPTSDGNGDDADRLSFGSDDDDDQSVGSRERCGACSTDAPDGYSDPSSAADTSGLDSRASEGPQRGTAPVLRTDLDAVELGEHYSTVEQRMTEFALIHPMANLEASNAEALAAMASRARSCVDVVAARLPIVSKSYEDMFLRPAREENGERPCAVGERCMCKAIAKARFGPGSNLGFVGVEFMLPAERERWRSGKGMPDRPGKCLVCIRYLVHYHYLRACSDPGFLKALRDGRIQIYQHAVAHTTLDADGVLRCDGVPMPSHANAANVTDGYSYSALLPVDAAFVDTRSGRDTSLGALQWLPFVRFDARHYQYVTENGEKRIVQVGVGCDTPRSSNASASHLNFLPSDDTTARPTAAPSAVANAPPPRA